MNVIDVKNFSDVDTTKYTKGTIFLSEDGEAGILVAGKIRPMTINNTLTQYKVQKMIEKALKEVKTDDK